MSIQGDDEITVKEAAKLFNRSEKQIRRIVEECVYGKKGTDGKYIVHPDPLFARQEAIDRGYGFSWAINKERLRKHFEEKMHRQLERLEKSRQATMGDVPTQQEQPISAKEPEKVKETVETPQPSVQSSSPNEAATVKVYDEMISTLKDQLKAKDEQLERKDKHIGELIAEVAASKERSDKLQGALIAIANSNQLDIQRIKEGEVAVVANAKPKEPTKKKGWFRWLGK